MRPDLHADITRRLLQDFEFTARSGWLRQGKCPECGQRELYTKAEAPWVLWCGRKNRCGAELHVKDLYRDLFENWSERYKSSDQQPHAAADAYLLHARGFPLARLRGCYTQEWYQDRERGCGSATVRFPLANGGWWERLIDRPERFGKMKARFAPGKSMQGLWWALPDAASDADTLYLTEGIFDTIALELAGFPSRALLSCNNYPAQALAALRQECAATGRRLPTLVFALDDGRAGHDYMRKWVERARAEGWDASAAYTPDRGRLKQDWNELWLRGRLNQDAMAAARYHGQLLLARSAQEKALLMYKRTGRTAFHFAFGDRLYWFEYNDAKYQKAREALEGRSETEALTEEEKRDLALEQSGSVAMIANCYPQALYYQANAQTDESWYYWRITSPDLPQPRNATFTAAQLSTASEFKKRMMHVAQGCTYLGSTAQLDRLFQDSTHRIKVVETIDFIGYSREHRCYVLGDVAVQDGQLHTINDEDYFELPGRLSIKSLNQSVQLHVNPAREDYRGDWLLMLWECFGAKGIVALTFWFGALFAEQIRQAQKSFPFLEVVGEAGSGKSTLVEFLWKLCGRLDYEGFDPSKSPAAARARNFAQVANLPVVLIEADREDTAKQRGFDWNELKTAYNGRSVRATGVKNAGNETREPPFRSAIVIAQNAPVNASDAILQRIVHLRFDKSGHTARTGDLAKALERMPVEHVSGFLLRAIQQEAKVLATVEDGTGHYTSLLLKMEQIKSVRIAKNHGQLMALLDALREVVDMPDTMYVAAHAAVMDMAAERQQAINADHPWVQDFWEFFEALDAREATRLNHSRSPAYIAINMVDFERALHASGLNIPGGSMTELKRVLPTSRRRKLVEVNRVINSQLTGTTKRCWIFATEATCTPPA